MLQQIKSFQECLKIAAESEKHLLLGNGFSISLFPEKFAYNALSEKVESKRINKLFKCFKTNDFEYVMHKLEEALTVVKLYNKGSDLYSCISKDLEELKKTLIEAISNFHPRSPQEILASKYEHCYGFLSHFNEGKKFTFNYDLLLYWVFMNFRENKVTDSLKCDDGFRGTEWQIYQEREQNFYYLHGAMHIFSDEGNIKKHTWKNDSLNTRITDQVSVAINNGAYPMFISGGNSKQKYSRIYGNNYLLFSFLSLQGIKGSLFIFGHSLRDEDDHVFNIINGNDKLGNIFISIFGEENSNQHIFTKVARWKQLYKNKKYYFYNAESANVWGLDLNS